MDFSFFQPPDSNNDVLINTTVSSISCQIQTSAVPTLHKPYFFSTPNPILPLSDHFAEMSNEILKAIPFTLLCDIFHNKINHHSYPPALCPKCNAYIPLDFFPEGTGYCPFCNNVEIPDSYLSFPNQLEPPKFLFLLIGNATDYFYDSISSFKYPLILMNYNDDHFIMCNYKNDKFNQVHLFDSDVPPNSFTIFPSDQKVPHFPDSIIYEADFDQIIGKLCDSILFLDESSPLNIVVFNTVPHTCLNESFHPPPHSTLTICSLNTFICSCSDICHKFGGLYLPHTQAFSIENLTQTYKVSLRVGNLPLQQENSLTLLFPGYFYIENRISSVSDQPITPIQILIEANERTFCFSTSFKNQVGLKPFLYSASLPNMLVSLNSSNRQFESIFAQYSKSVKDSVIIPSSLQYALLFPKLSPRRTLHHVLSHRPFVLQVLPTLRVIDYVSQSICTTISILLILFESTIYIFVGSDVKKETWMSMIGVPPSSQMISFEILNVEDSFQSELWTAIRAIRKMYYPYWIPIIVVPNESGRRVQLMQILKCDIIDGSNVIYKKYTSIAREVVFQ